MEQISYPALSTAWEIPHFGMYIIYIPGLSRDMLSTKQSQNRKEPVLCVG